MRGAIRIETSSYLSGSASQRSRAGTNWYVITGGPCSGKTTTVDLLRKQGYKTTVEEARHYLDLQRAQGKSLKELKRNRKKFQLKVLKDQIKQESMLDPKEIVFLDRAIPDAKAYYRFWGLPEDHLLAEAMKTVWYKKVFILECLPLVKDYARHEDVKAQERIQELLTTVYESLPFQVIHVPVMPVELRLKLILANL
jgi:predicted ATPase